MLRYVSLFLILCLPVSADELVTFKNFDAAKRYLAALHEDLKHETTLYCGCPYERHKKDNGEVDQRKSGGDIVREACGLEARKNDERSDRLEWEHVVPASWFGQTRACWKLKGKVYPECRGKNGRKGLSGRDCCEKVNHHFDLAHNDPNNLFPSSGEVNGDRLNHPYGVVDGEPRVYGSCDFEMEGSGANKVAEPSELSKGTVARAMLYMSEVYGVNIRLDFDTLWQWHIENPAEAWEIQRAQRIADDTGLRNRWVHGD